MAPYKVVLRPPNGDTLSLVVPFDGSRTFEHLFQEVLRRASKRCTLPSSTQPEHLRLCLNSEDGFLIEPDDIIQEVLTGSEILFIVFPAAPCDNDSSHTGSDIDKADTERTVQIRVITPELAQRTHDHGQIPLLDGGRRYPLSATLGQIGEEIAEHLQTSLVAQNPPADDECNCRLAELLEKRGIWEKISCHGHINQECTFESPGLPLHHACAQCSEQLIAHKIQDSSSPCGAYLLRRVDLPCGHVVHSQCLHGGVDYDCPTSCYAMESVNQLFSRQLLVVSGTGIVEQLKLKSMAHSDLMAALSDRFEECLHRSKVASCKGGAGGSRVYTRLPIVAICARKRHGKDHPTLPEVDKPSLPQLDLHTVESPLNMGNLDLTLESSRLCELEVDGVVTLYAVKRKSSAREGKAMGKNAMFAAAEHWNLPAGHSDRGMAAFLASLRVFAHVVGSEEFDDIRKNGVLQIVHYLTQFPPAVRATHILMDGKTLLPFESAALVQSLAAVCEELIPFKLVAGDSRRCLEGARLVLGFILYQAKNLASERQGTAEDLMGLQGSIPYITNYHTVDMKDVKTMEIVTRPVLTNVGLVDRAVFDVFKVFSDSQLLKHSPSCNLEELRESNSSKLRVALLYGGGLREAPYYQGHLLAAKLRDARGSRGNPFDMKELAADISFLASLCEGTPAVVVSPNQLPRAKAPSLTLDRNGNLAVYTGHAPCARPGREHAVFHPLSGLEENIDVTIVMQQLGPIIEGRKQDGTNVFDLFSATYRRKETFPTEMLMFCVDCSQSMNRGTTFYELKNEVEYPRPIDESLLEYDDSDITFEDMKSWLCHHECFNDMLGTLLYDASEHGANAHDILAYWITVTRRHIEHLIRTQHNAVPTAPSLPHFQASASVDIQLLRRILAGLKRHSQALADFLVFSAFEPGYTPTEISWSYGDPIPSGPAAAQSQTTTELEDVCDIPHEYLCPITRVLFEDPVVTTDGTIFERKAIERWYRISQTSPLTGLPVADTQLSYDHGLAVKIEAWVKAEDVVQSIPPARKRLRSSSGRPTVRVHFVAPSVSFTREVNTSASLVDLHKIVFRGLRGLYTRFLLHLRGALLPCSDDDLLQWGVSSDETISVTLLNAEEYGGPDDPTGKGEMCLVRVYEGSNENKELFKYWVPLHSGLTFESICFRYARFHTQNVGRSVPPQDVSPWTVHRLPGDDTWQKTPHQAWDYLSPVLQMRSRCKIQQCEKLYASRKDSRHGRSAVSDVGGDSARNYRILKVSMEDYIPPEQEELNKRRKQGKYSRMAVTKQVFDALINRLIAYSFPTQVGLVTFGTKAKMSQKLTDVVENFRRAVEKMEGRGKTALWDALALASDHMEEVAQQYPDAAKRIICLSDGEDTGSKLTHSAVCQMFRQRRVVVDSVSISSDSSSTLDLRLLSYLTAGYKFSPKTIEEAAALCELEPVLSIDERPPINQPSDHYSSADQVAQPDHVTNDEYPARKTHPKVNDSFVHIAAQSQRTGRSDSVNNQPHATNPSVRSRRLLQEIQDIVSHPHPSYDVYVSESNMAFWKIVLEGPDESSYEGGTFVFYLDMGEHYPLRAPSGRFLTRIFHPNINRHGRICHSIFDRNWTVDTTNKQVLDTVFGLLLVPEFTDPINTTVTLDYYWDEVAFKEQVQQHIRKYASESRQEAGKAIMGG
ncbi:hypothetical protein HRR77_008557 [Exophiala dermatitidis]|nr:hypothetical protein HRR75_008236 [Exophiala dermatitidis]KAJ4533583.1 hypothetical protein HRR77_008557 [Exophiala dermatitidis]KAJ4538638.1 hypothetical protein HRR78_008170 [Exophiala dermatitidis]